MRLQGRVAVVTGGASGIGAAVCRTFAREGAAVAVVDVDAEGAERQAADLPRAIFATVDVTDTNAVDAVVARTAREFGGLDIVAHVAGIDDPVAKRRMGERMRDGEPLDATITLTDEQWLRMISVNLTGAFYVTRASLRVMLPRASGSIVHMSSIAGVHGYPGIPHYSAAKAGLIGLTRSVAKEVADQGVRINAVAPGGVDTPMAARRVPGLSPAGRLPLGRLATAEEVADTVLFLASDESAYITGEVINVNGGVLTV